MKVLLVAAESSYSIGRVLEKAFKKAGHSVVAADQDKAVSSLKAAIRLQAFRLPYKLRTKLESGFYRDINKALVERFDREKPDMVFIYNDSNLLPDSIQHFRKSAKAVFYLGDNPFYTWTKPLFLNLLMEADFIFAPDTMWIDQLKMLGIKNIEHALLGWDDETYKRVEVSPEDRERYTSDAVFIGNSYVINWGFKRTLFLNQFSRLDLRIYGTRHWQRWLEYFPELKKRYVHIPKPLSLETVNMICNCCKIYPVDANPGLLHGIHARVLDCIGSGILPLVEYRKDIDLAFPSVKPPLIHNYDKAEETAAYYLNHDEERQRLVEDLHRFIRAQYSSMNSLKKIVSRIL